MRLRLGPRFRLRLLLFSLASFLVLLGTISHCRAFELRRRVVLSRVDLLDRRLNELSELVQNQKIVSDPTARDDFLYARQTGVSSNIPRPRFLASGRSGSWLYSDVRLPSGLVRRYYVRDDADRRAVALWVRRISEDVRDDLDGYFAPVVEDSDF